jgi:hypothetical protein
MRFREELARNEDVRRTRRFGRTGSGGDNEEQRENTHPSIMSY